MKYTDEEKKALEEIFNACSECEKNKWNSASVGYKELKTLYKLFFKQAKEIRAKNLIILEDIAKKVQSKSESDLDTFCGVPIDEAVDVVTSYKEKKYLEFEKIIREGDE